jgi:hypothetical protein
MKLSPLVGSLDGGVQRQKWPAILLINLITEPIPTDENWKFGNGTWSPFVTGSSPPFTLVTSARFISAAALSN